MDGKETAVKIAKAFVKDCKDGGLKFRKVLLFGSSISDRMHQWSDIDLILVSDQFNENIFENLRLFSRVNIKYPVIEAHPYSTNYFLEGDSFLDEVKKECVEIE